MGLRGGADQRETPNLVALPLLGNVGFKRLWQVLPGEGAR